MSKAKHIATFPLFGSNPITGQVDTRKRVGTGYIHRHEQIAPEEERLARYGHPLRLMWRNIDCFRQYAVWLAALSKAEPRP